MEFKISKHLNENNFHHAYLIEGNKDEIVNQILQYMESIGINTIGNSDFYHIKEDNIKIDHAKNLKSLTYEKSFSDGKRFFLISTNNILLEAQNTLLKIFEEPILNTVFFVVLPSADTLLKTFVSRFYRIKADPNLDNNLKNAEMFLKMEISGRLSFLKDFILVKEKEGEDSIYLKAINFLNALETTLHNKILKEEKYKNIKTDFFEHFFKVREFLRQPGSSAKTLMESIAIIVPNL